MNTNAEKEKENRIVRKNNGKYPHEMLNMNKNIVNNNK